MTVWCLLTGSTVVEGRTSIRLGHITNPFLWEQPESGSAWEAGDVELLKSQRTRYVNGRYLCGERDDECSLCWRSRGTASAHIDCLLGFKNGKTYHNKLHRLWRFAQARRPHPNMPELLLPELTSVPTTHLAALPPSSFFSILTRLPQEVLQLVREHSTSSPLWQILAGLDLSDLLSALPRHTPAHGSLPLNDIASWERGNGVSSIVLRRGRAHGLDGSDSLGCSPPSVWSWTRMASRKSRVFHTSRAITPTRDTTTLSSSQCREATLAKLMPRLRYCTLYLSPATLEVRGLI